MLSKIRPNVLYLGTIVAAMVVVLAVMLIDKVDVLISNEILSLLVGIGIGGLLTVVGQVASDPPPPTIPAELHLDVIKRLLEGTETEVEVIQDEAANKKA